MEKSQLYEYNETNVVLKKMTVSEAVSSFDFHTIDKSVVSWLNFHTIEPRTDIEHFFEKQGFHRLTLDDVYTERHRPKLEEFNDYLFFSIQSALPKDKNGKLAVEQISFILGERFLISFQERSSDHFKEVRARIEQKIGKIRERSSDFLLFRLLDAIIDNYFEALDDIIELNEELETRVLKDTSSSMLTRIELQKQKLIELRKIVIPMRDIAVQLEKTQNPLISDIVLPYYSDLKDNCLSILDDIDTHRQVLEGLSNIYFAAQGQKMNEIMKVLTIVSTIFIPLTFIVGVYGMNFRYMPELDKPNGYFIVWGIMVVLALLMAIFFFRKGWLKKG
jgi:magnesium transporter